MAIKSGCTSVTPVVTVTTINHEDNVGKSGSKLHCLLYEVFQQSQEDARKDMRFMHMIKKLRQQLLHTMQ